MTIATAKISSQGQITIPAALRQVLGLSSGDTVIFSKLKNKATIQKVPDHDMLVAKWTSTISPKLKPLKNVDKYYRQRRARV